MKVSNLLILLPIIAVSLSLFTVFYIGSLHTHDHEAGAVHGKRQINSDNDNAIHSEPIAVAVGQDSQNNHQHQVMETKVVHVSLESQPRGHSDLVRIGASSSDHSVKEAIVLAVNIPMSPFGLKLKSEDVFVAASYHSLEDGAHYSVLPLPTKTRSSEICAEQSAKDVPAEQPQQLSRGIRNKQGIVLSDKPARLPRVVLTALGTGRYRSMALDALKSAADFFGGDCVPTYHLITDNLTDVDPRFNAVHAPYREWPESGLSKFEDIRNALEPHILKADYFFFMDADIRFKERVELADVAGDLVGVEHPMYPRYGLGWCKPGDPTTRGWCAYPFSRDNKSTAYIPETHGRYLKEGKYVVSNAYYYQSAFWGGKSDKVMNLIRELEGRITTNRANGVYSKIIQDELFLNWYMWKHSNDSDLNIRTLSPSYLYPMQTRGFSDWVTKENRAIIVHGIGKKAGKLINGATELHMVKMRLCVDRFAGTGWDKVGLYGCNHVADSQGLFYDKDKGIIRSMASGVHRCMDASGLKPLDDLMFQTCDPNNKAMKWTVETTTNLIRNQQQPNLCLDSLRDPTLVGDEVSKNKKKPLGVNTCNAQSNYQLFEFRPI